MKKILILVVLFVVVASQLVIAFDKYDWMLLTDQEKELYLQGYFDGLVTAYYEASFKEYVDEEINVDTFYSLMKTFKSYDDLIKAVDNSFIDEDDNTVWFNIYHNVLFY
ncbi:hypothetical protein LCGC14_1958840 [marine sediment metagenome]|uniref:Uncharacterized protein n=1 Tax=marine sediment metagenome TaxID=412755 RepID=A0A0F9ICA7_9ZZZZ